MKRLCVAMLILMTIVAVGCGNNKVADSGAASSTVSEPEAVEASTLGVPAVKDGVLRPGEDCAEVYFEWDPVEGADGYEVSEENKYYSEKEYREPEKVEVVDNSYVTGAQDYFDFRIRVRYQYFRPLDDPETVLLIDSWTDQEAIDAHHASPMMKQLAELREKYDLHMTVERFVSDELGDDEKFIRK
ncbi:putative quinol monooxygenase [Butyrivibrio sp. YAB3001]|uniref:putative quinol monooxygenase n=1 Tax=Butyrivibrio sp. YAB3001 TaxID=1520812 RepID=UPI0008F65A9C|nr:antibiotic biosynthesis monooxygenase [Butyrivibrio sp. YAB3001]SFC97402.1 Antibiotic biosynthesis monooxygenase [Butyrivibrio sp. YAB3001]